MQSHVTGGQEERKHMDRGVNRASMIKEEVFSCFAFVQVSRAWRGAPHLYLVEIKTRYPCPVERDTVIGWCACFP
jgi:hypothetical protein